MLSPIDLTRKSLPAISPIAVLAIALALASPSAVAQSGAEGPTPGRAAKKDVRPPRTRPPQGQIACGRYGCVRIPPNCHPEQTFDRWGNPTGYDAVICR